MTKSYQNALSIIINQCSSLQVTCPTPSDLTFNRFPIDLLKELTDKYPVEDIYLLSPLQEGILFHVLYADNASSANFTQLCYSIRAEINLRHFRTSLVTLVKKYAILRTFFSNDGLGRYYQIVLDEPRLNFEYYDISGLENEELVNFVERLKHNDRETLFDLFSKYPIRFKLVKTSADEYELIWSYHHILMDGWCIGILIKDFFSIYQSLADNRQKIEINAAPKYSDYIKWIQSWDDSKARDYWVRHLAGYKPVSVIPKIFHQATPLGEVISGLLNFRSTRRSSTKYNCRLRERMSTLNSFFLTIWGILLAKGIDSNDVVVGTIFSGRSPEVANIERMVGLFINSVPFRVRYNQNTSFSELLVTVQNQVLNHEQYQFYPLAEIQREGGQKKTLFDHVFVFENYPDLHEDVGLNIDESTKVTIDRFELSRFEVYEPNPYDFSILIIPKKELIVKFLFNSALCDDAGIDNIWKLFNEIVEHALKDTSILVSNMDVQRTLLMTDSDLHLSREGFNF